MPKIGEIKREKGRKHIWLECKRCGIPRWVRVDYQSRYCRRCGCKITGDKNRGENNQNWKGGIRRSYGYVLQRIFPDNFFFPMAKGDGYVMMHRLVVAKHLSRCLLPWEVVHHKNGIKDDNRIENLELLTDKRFHLVDMKTKSYITALENKIRLLQTQ